MSPVLEKIANLPGVSALLHHRGGILLAQRLPDTLSADEASALCNAVSRAFAIYAGAGRLLREAWFEFPNRCVLVVARPSEDAIAAPAEFLTMIVSDRTVSAPASQAAVRFWTGS